MRLSELFSQVDYHAHLHQLKFHESDARFKLLIAGARFGKSLASARDVLVDALGGKSRGWLVAPTYGLTRPEFRYIRDDILTTMRGSVDQTNHPPALHASWGAEVTCMSARLPETLLGEEVDWLILCEAAHLDREAFDRFLRARLVSRNGRLLVPTTPRGHNWIHDLYQQADGPDDWHVLQGATWENPHVSASEIESARRSLPPEVFAEQFAGEFVTPFGRVYAEFDYDKHVGEFTPPPGTLIFRGIDFGYTSPFACLWGCLDEHGTLQILREYYRPNAAIGVHAEQIRQRDARYQSAGCRIGPAFVDPSGAEQRHILRSEGLQVVPARNELKGGIEVVRQRLMVHEGVPGLRINPACVNLLREMDAYVWERGIAGEDHALDALRYLCVSLQQRVGWKDKGFVW